MFISYDHFESNCFDTSWKPQNKLFYKDQTIKRRLGQGSVPSIFSFKEQPVVRELWNSGLTKKKKRVKV